MIRAVLFDLDDTLYCEGDFVRSGFAAVARELESRGVGSGAALCQQLETIHFTEGRERVLHKLAERLGFTDAWIPELVERYCGHVPNITLAADVVATLARLRTCFALGCVTDGWAATQRRKIDALGLRTYVDAIVISDELGRQHWKPSSRPFLTCCELLGASPEYSIYVGDDPERDMRGARNAGMRSVRIRREQAYFRDCSSETDQPDFEIVSLHELERLLQ